MRISDGIEAVNRNSLVVYQEHLPVPPDVADRDRVVPDHIGAEHFVCGATVRLEREKFNINSSISFVYLNDECSCTHMGAVIGIASQSSTQQELPL